MLIGYCLLSFFIVLDITFGIVVSLDVTERVRIPNLPGNKEAQLHCADRLCSISFGNGHSRNRVNVYVRVNDSIVILVQECLNVELFVLLEVDGFGDVRTGFAKDSIDYGIKRKNQSLPYV